MLPACCCTAGRVGCAQRLGHRKLGIRHAGLKHAALPALWSARQRGLRPVQASPGLEHLLLDSTLPVLKIGVVASVGAVSAHYGLLNADVRRALSHLAINVFTPALMITKLAPHTDLASALSLSYIGANVILCHFVGLGLGLLHTRLLPTPPGLRRVIHVSSSIANTGNLPLVLVLSLIKSPDLPFNTTAQADLAVSYIMLGWWYATLVQMPLGTLLLHKPCEKQAGSTAAAFGTGSSSSGCSGGGSSIDGSSGSNGSTGSSTRRHGSGPRTAADSAWQGLAASQQHLPAAAALQSLSMQHMQFSSTQQPLQAAQLSTTAPAAGVPARWAAYGQQVAPRTSSPVAVLERPPVHTCTDLLSLELQLNAAAQHWELTGSRNNNSSSSSSSGSSSSNGGQQTAVQQAQADTLWPMFAPLSQLSAAGSQPPQQHADQQELPQLELPQLPQPQQQQQQVAKWQQQWEDVGQPLMKGVLSAPLIAGVVAIMIGSCPPLQQALFSPRGSLSLVGDVLDMLGQPLIPVLLLALGANLSNGPQLASGAHLPPLNVAGVIFTKLLLSPLLGLGVVLGAQKAGLLGEGTDPLAVLVMMVAWATPTAVLVHSLSLVHKNGEDEVSALLFYEYLAAALTLPLCSTTYLYLLGCCVPHVA